MNYFAQTLNEMTADLDKFFSQSNPLRSILILFASMVIAYWLSDLIAKIIVRFAQKVAARSDSESDDTRALRLRQVETYLSVTIAIVRTMVVVVVGFVMWLTISPVADSSMAAIGAGTVFIVVAGQTIGILLRDITAGSVMIAERWFNVGDFIKVEPFWDVAGVVERFTLRSTRIRALNGEIIHIHNQHMTAVHITPRGLRTMEVEVFVRDRDKGEKALREIINTMPSGKLMVARQLRIMEIEKWGDDLWQFTIQGQTAPGREWLIEKYFIDAIKAIDEGVDKAKRLVIHEPIVHFADPEAERKFKRAVRLAREKDSPIPEK